MADFDVQITGLRELDDALRELAGPAARRAMRKGMRQGANVVRDEAKARAPKDTGNLKKSIRTRERREEGGWMRYAIEVRRRAFYGRFLEFGTSKMAAKPFLRPAAENKTAEAVERMRDAMGEAVLIEMQKAHR